MYYVHKLSCPKCPLAVICNNTGLEASNFYVMRPNSGHCYRYFQSDKNYFDANRTCFRTNGLLARIDSQSENDYIYQLYFLRGGQRPFWIGMDDQDQEGVFKYVCIVIKGSIFTCFIADG